MKALFERLSTVLFGLAITLVVVAAMAIPTQGSRANDPSQMIKPQISIKYCTYTYPNCDGWCFLLTCKGPYANDNGAFCDCN